MKFQFNAQEPYQLEAIRSVVDLFKGQSAAAGAFEWRAEFLETELIDAPGVANALSLKDARLLENLRAVQEHNKLELARTLACDGKLGSRNFSVEMETGTGKTYVFLRTIHELHRTYGWTKFVIVVPSVPIREGVTQSLDSMAEHFESIYGRVPLDKWVYDSSQASRLRQFALSNQLQVLVINIQAFDKKSVAVVHQESDQMQGRRPIEFIQQSRPVVIMDEPQNMESDTAKEAIRSLNPLFTLRYSATHRNIYNLVYRLDPVRAYDLGLVKRIEVASVTDEGDFNHPFVGLESVSASRGGLVAKLMVDVRQAGGVKRRHISVRKNGADLFELSNRREIYRGFKVTEINAERGFVAFGNGVELNLGQTRGGKTDEVMRAQIEETIREHFDRELSLRDRSPGQRIKVLSLFFIDRVANYAPAEGKIRRWFEEGYRNQTRQAKYSVLAHFPVEKVHNGYFASDKNGPKDSNEGKSTKADDDAYQLIMRDKERLLSPDEPLRFIFSHSALREGWDNPNVFQICTLREGQSEIRKRQEVGRGLRLARVENGFRCSDPAINRLTLIANESFADFARKLQTELEEECGVSFEGRIANRRERRRITLNKERLLSEDFCELWERISRKTRYQVEFSTEEIVKRAARLLKNEPDVSVPQISVLKSEVRFAESRVDGVTKAARSATLAADSPSMPDVIGYLQRETELTRTTLVDILQQSERVDQVLRNPQEFMERAASAIQHAKRELMVDGIRYERIADQSYEMRLFESEEIESYLSRLLPVAHSLYDAVEYDSEVERKFAAELDVRDDVKLFVKLPRWFVVPTPLGDYRPDWAIVRETDGKVYLVVETKGSKDLKTLPETERWKVKCGEQHFYCLNVPYEVASESDDLH